MIIHVLVWIIVDSPWRRLWFSLSGCDDMLAIFLRALNSLALNVLESAQVSLSLEALELEGGDGSPQGDGIA